MTDATEADAPPAKTRGPLRLLLAAALAIAGGAGGYWGVSMLRDAGPDVAAKAPAPEPLGRVAFVPLDPLTVAVSSRAGREHLRVRLQIETIPEYAAEIEMILPRLVDVANTYLRAVDLSDLESPEALMKLRTQLLRRFGIIAGEGRVQDLLVMEFVIN